MSEDPMSQSPTSPNPFDALASGGLDLNALMQQAQQVQEQLAATQQQLGNFYVQVVNSHSGLGGLAMRGAGVREKLAEEFALESSRILTGSTKKDWKKRVKAEEDRAEASGSSSATGA